MKFLKYWYKTRSYSAAKRQIENEVRNERARRIALASSVLDAIDDNDFCEQYKPIGCTEPFLGPHCHLFHTK